MKTEIDGFCILCLIFVGDKNNQTLNDTIKEMLKVLLVTLDIESTFSNINEFQDIESTKIPLVCCECLNKLKNAFRFKSVCTDTEDALLPYINPGINQHIDLKKIWPNGQDHKDIQTEDMEVCRLCKNCMHIKSSICLTEMLEVNNVMEVFEKHLPEISVSAFNKPVICVLCQTSLLEFADFMFVISCQNIEVPEEIINHEIVHLKNEILSETDEPHTSNIKEEIECMDTNLIDTVNRVKSESDTKILGGESRSSYGYGIEQSERPGYTLQQALERLYHDENNSAGSIPALYIAPPDPNVETDEDSGEEDGAGLIDNLSGKQLSASAEIRWGLHNYEDVEDDEEKTRLEPPVKKLKSEVNARKVNKKVWIDGDMEKHTDFDKPNYSIFHDNSPLELFELFFDDDILMSILNETKKYALHLNCQDPDIRLEEIKCFFGIIIFSGYHPLPGRRYYWDQECDMGVDMVKYAMRRNRFEQVMRSIHCVDNTQIDTMDTMWKLRPLINKIKRNFLKYFQPTEHISYGESMIKYYGRHPCKQNIKSKPIRFGYKTRCLNAESGYLINFNLEGNKADCNLKYKAEFGVVNATLLSMLDEIPGRNLPYQIFLNYLSMSFNLLTKLKMRGYGVTGTLCENRVPKDCPLINKTAMAKNVRGSFESKISKDEGIIIVRWMDSGVVTVASTTYGTRPLSSVKRFCKVRKKIIQFTRPNVIEQYYKNIMGTERMDEDVRRYRISIRGNKWYWPVFTWLIDVSINNAWILYKHSSPERKGTPNLIFRREIARTYLERFANPPSHLGRFSMNPFIINNRILDGLRYDRIDHFVITVPNKKRRRCVRKGCTSVIRTQCSKCDVGLCIECFSLFHTK